MNAAIQLIIDQFKEMKNEISTTTAELKADMCVVGTGQESLQSDKAAVIDDKVGHCISAITEGMKTEMNDLRSEVSALELKTNEGQAEMEGKWEKK
jgi:hypothetical protein